MVSQRSAQVRQVAPAPQVRPQVAAHPVGQVTQVVPQVLAQVAQVAQVPAHVLKHVLAQVGPQLSPHPVGHVIQVAPRQVSQVSQVANWVSLQVRGLQTVQPLGHSKAVGQPISVAQPARVGPGHSASQVSANAIARGCANWGCTANGSLAPAVAVRT